MTNLIDNFIEIMTRGNRPLQHVINDMNDDLDTNYGLSRVGDWKNGKRSVPERVQRYMLQMTINSILFKFGIDVPSVEDEYVNPLVDALMPPDRDV